MSVVIVVSVAQEAEAIVSAWGSANEGIRASLPEGVRIVVGGIGRTNASAATTQAILQRKGGEVKAVVCAGIAGALPAKNAEEQLSVGDCIVASACVYAEEGIVTSAGFAGMEGLGFSLGDFVGNAVPVGEELLEMIAGDGVLGVRSDSAGVEEGRERRGGGVRIGPVATVATCSGTDAAAVEVVKRTGALAEAMEGAAVVHAARRLGVPAIEVRVISNTTGERKKQVWDVPGAMKRLGEVMREAVERIR